MEIEMLAGNIRQYADIKAAAGDAVRPGRAKNSMVTCGAERRKPGQHLRMALRRRRRGGAEHSSRRLIDHSGPVTSPRARNNASIRCVVVVFPLVPVAR